MILPLFAAVVFQGGLIKTDAVIGRGGAAKPGDYLTILYTGKLTNGTVFDSTAKHWNEPFNFVLGAGQVIAGWDQGVAGMKVGGKRKLTIPGNLGYGAQGTPDGSIPGGATIIFDVELKKIDHLQDLTILKKGSGPSAKGRDHLKIDFTMSLKGGKSLGSNVGKPPVDFTIGTQTLPGLNAALIGMQLGEKRRVTIPPSMALGSKGNGQVPPNASFVVEVTLRELNGKAAK